MATRSSRLRGGAESTAETPFNRTRISFYGTDRLKKECSERGLPTTGSKQALSNRLEDWCDGVYVAPTESVAPAESTPSTSRNGSAKTTPNSHPNSGKSAPSKRTPRRRTSVASTGEEEATEKAVEAPPKKKARRNSTKKGQSSRECSLTVKEDEIIEENFSVTILSTPAVPQDQFDSDDDQPLIRVSKNSTGVEASPIVPAADVENDGNEEKEVRKKKKRRRKEDEDIESGAVLPKGDSEWVPPEESEKRTTRDSSKKRTRKNTVEMKEDEPEECSSGSMPSMPLLDPEIFDQEEDDQSAKSIETKAPTDRQRKISTGDGSKKAKKEMTDGSSIDRPRLISNATAAVSKEKRRESTSVITPRPKEKPATQVYAEIMAQKKAADAARAAAAAASAVNGVGTSTTVGTPTSNVHSTVLKMDKDEKGSSGGASPLLTEKRGRRDSTGAVGSPAADGTTPKGFSMSARRNAPPRPVVPTTGASDLLGGLIDQQKALLLEKKAKSTAEAEAEKIRIVSKMKQSEINLETVNKEKERLQKEDDEKKRIKEERDRKERERKALIIPAPTRPIPPPPPFPPPSSVKNESGSPSDQKTSDPAVETAAKAVKTVKEEIIEPILTPPFEPLEDYAMTNVVVPVREDRNSAEYEPEYEPLMPGPSMPCLDRSLADEHHRKRMERAKGRRKDSKDHGLVAPEVPFSANDPFLLSLSSKLRKIIKQREESPISDDIRECMEDLLKKVESKVEKEMKWEWKTKRKTEYQVEREKEEEKKRAQMMSDPRALLAKATNILENMNMNGSMDEDMSDSPSSGTGPSTSIHISQALAEPGTYEVDTEEKPLPEFHGEPVPSDDEEALFLEAAGLPKKDKKPKHPVVEEEAPPSHEHILMDYYNACLHIKSATDKPWLIEPDNENGLALMWGGVRTNHGYILPWREEKSCLVFQIKITEHQSVRHILFNEQEPHDVRVGFSLRAAPNVLGEAPSSWAFSTTGKKGVNNVFHEWGDPIEIGDVVTTVLDFSSKSISYYKNEELMGVAFKNIVLPEDGDAIYAHVCVKNCKVAVNLGEFPEVEGGWGELVGTAKVEESESSTSAPITTRDPQWVFPTEIERKRYEMSRLPPNEKAGCTVLMMVGLPGVGKSTWVRQYIRDHPDEKWDVINSEGVMAAMKVNGVARGRAHTGRWDMILGLVAKALQKMVLLAARRRRNYIIDLSNVNKDSRKRRLMHFKDFTKKCIVIVPDEEEMVNRQMKQTRQEGASHVPAEAILEMKAVFTFPTEEAEGFDEVHLIEPAMPRIAEAIEIIQRFNDEGKPWYHKRYRGRGGGRRGGGRGGGYMGDRRGSGEWRGGGGGANDFNRPLSVSTAASNGSGPPTNVGGGSRPSPGAWGKGESPSTTGNFSWASRKTSN